MAFVYAYSLDGDNSNAINDLPLDTLANYKTAGTNGVTKGDLVFQSSGLLRRNGVTTGAGIGVLEGTEFMGLVAQGQPYAATNSSFTANALNTTIYPNGLGKVRMDKSSCVYKVPVYQTGAVVTATNAHLGSTFALGIDAAGDQTVDLNTTTTPAVKVVGLAVDGKSVFVQLV
jgi:hypothetical protein